MKRLIFRLFCLCLIFSLLSGVVACQVKEKTDSVIDTVPSGNDTDSGMAFTEDAEEIFREVFDEIYVSDSENAFVSDGSLKVESLENIDGNYVARCTQTFCGVDIYGSSIVAISGDDKNIIGTYYNLEEAFGDDFEELKAEAAKVPDWMCDGYCESVYVSYHTDTLKPVIYITEGEAVVARQFDVTLSKNGSPERYTLVMDMDGEICYGYEDYVYGFSPTTTGGINVAELDGYIYAFDMENHAYISTVTEIEADEVDDYRDESGAVVKKSLVYKLNGNSGDDLALEVLSTMSEVLGWYKNSFGYVGVDGNGGEYMVIYDYPYSNLNSVAANVGEYGHIIICCTTKKGTTVADAPEILVHEISHAILKNRIKLSNSNASGSIHEAVSDIFACLYDPDADWVIGEGLGVSYLQWDLTTYNSTMKDFRYDCHYIGGEYVGDSAILTYLSSKVVGKEQSNKDECRYGNAEIVSGTMYKIWKNVFEKDSELFARVLWDSINYLPSTADFSQFRDAFMFSTGKHLDSEAMRRVGTQFDVAGINYNSKNYVRMRRAETPSTLEDMMEKTYGAVNMLIWDDKTYTSSFGYWYGLFYKENFNLSFTYEGDNQADKEAIPISLSAYDYSGVENALEVTITDGLTMGMTYGQIAQKFDVSPLVNEEYQSPEYPVYATLKGEKYSYELYFEGYDESAVCMGVLITRNGTGA